jgi:hypothetical protein
VNVPLALLVVFGALLATIMTARAVHVSGREAPQMCPPPASYVGVIGAHGGASCCNADHNADGAICPRPGTPLLPMPTPSNDLIDNRGCS